MHRLRKENLSINKDYLFKLLKKELRLFFHSQNDFMHICIVIQ